MASNLPRNGYRGPRFINSDRVLLVTLLLALSFLLGYWSGKAMAVDAEPVEVVETAAIVAPIPEKVLAEVETPAELPEPTPEPLPVPDPVETEEIDAAPSYTEAQLEQLALVIYQEAGGDACSDDTRLKVGTVVMNRVADDRFPGTIEEVLLQERQYGRLHWTGLVWPARAELPQEAHAVARAYDIAERILSGERYLPEDVIFQSEYIQGEIVAEQDGFYFCR